MRDPEGRGRVRTRLSWATVRHSSARGILVACFAGAILAGCVAGSSATPAGPASMGAAATASPTSKASATASIQAAPKRQETIAVGGDARLVDLFVPATPAGARAPLLLLLHASGESPFVMAAESHADELAARKGVVVALPRPIGGRWDAMAAAGDPMTPSADAAYILGLVDRLKDELAIDPERIFVAGFSIGAVMSERMACEHADRFTAVALNAGAPWSDECSPIRPVPILVMHGTADSTFRIALAGDVVDRWRAADECSGAPVVTQLSDIATSDLNDHCAGGAQVQFVRYEGAGHRWFADPDATDVMWAFFSGVAPR